MPDTTHSSLHGEIESLRSEIRQLQVDLAALSDSMRGVLRAGKDEAIGRVSDSADKAWNEAKEMAEGLMREIEKKPLTALVSAFSIGMLLGMLFSGRRS